MPFIPAKYIPHVLVAILVVTAFLGGHFLWPHYTVQPTIISTATQQPSPIIPAPAPGSNGNAVAHRWYNYIGIGQKTEVATPANPTDVATMPTPPTLQPQSPTRVAVLERKLSVQEETIVRLRKDLDKVLKKSPFEPPPSKPAATNKGVPVTSRRLAAHTAHRPAANKRLTLPKAPTEPLAQAMQENHDGQTFWDGPMTAQLRQ